MVPDTPGRSGKVQSKKDKTMNNAKNTKAWSEIFGGPIGGITDDFGPPRPCRASREGPTAFATPHESSRAVMSPVFGHVAQKCERFLTNFKSVIDYRHFRLFTIDSSKYQ